MRFLNEKIPYACEVFIAKATDGIKPWHHFYGYPQYGASYMLFDLGSPTYLGNAHCVFPFMNFFLTKPERIAGLNMRFGAGAGYVEKKYHPVNNYKNAAISTHLNAFLFLGIEGRVRLSTSLHLSGGLAFTHISNGTLRKPNTGLNNVMASAGASYAFGTEKPLVEKKYFNLDRKWNYTVYLSGGVKTYTQYNNTKYTVTGLSFEVSRRLPEYTSFSGTLDLFYDRSDYAHLVRKEI